MSILKINNDDIENFTIVTSPRRRYSFSKHYFPDHPDPEKQIQNWVTGSVNLFIRRSSIEKDSKVFKEKLDDKNFDNEYSSIVGSSREKTNISNNIQKYLDLVSSVSEKEQTVLEIERFTPTTRFTKYTLIKNNIKDVLMRHYVSNYNHADWSYTNYHTLNFFSSNKTINHVVVPDPIGGDDIELDIPYIPTGSVLMYPNSTDPETPSQEGYVSGTYCLSGAFSFDFHINPRYKSDSPGEKVFSAGTIFHLSSSYCLSLVSGSSKDENGYPVSYRLKLQLSHSADIAPSISSPGNYPNNLIFLSDDNSLLHNNWHHVCIRWGTNLVREGEGDFIIDGKSAGTFKIPSGTIMPEAFDSSGPLNPDVLFVGNYYEGQNSGGDSLSFFFEETNSTRDGLVQLTDAPLAPGYDEPTTYQFRHPLKAEIHDLSIRRYYMSDNEVLTSMTQGPGLLALDKSKFAFYLPPFFTEESPIRKFVGDRGGILQTPFFEINGTTDDPFNVSMAFGVNGHYINLENFTKDFSSNKFPRLFSLTASAIDYTTQLREANDFLYDDGGVAKRNLTILPCDDGNFSPNYSILSAEKYKDKFIDDYGAVDYSKIDLGSLVTSASLVVGVEADDEFVKQMTGYTPENPGLEPGPKLEKFKKEVEEVLENSGEYLKDKGVQRGVPLTIYSRTLDSSSNQVTFFNISNLYYGRRIRPGSFELKDSYLSGSDGSFGITIKDDGAGNLYRADSITPHCTQNSVGNIFYDEGVVVIKNPHLYFIGKEQYEMSFRGVQQIYTTKYEVLAPSGLLNSSSNSTYTSDLRASGDITDSDKFIYISGLNFHDENMNVIAKASMAQPIIKRTKDKLLFKVTFDW